MGNQKHLVSCWCDAFFGPQNKTKSILVYFLPVNIKPGRLKWFYCISRENVLIDLLPFKLDKTLGLIISDVACSQYDD